MRAATRLLVFLLALLALVGSVPRPPHVRLAAGRIARAPWPYFPGSTIPVRISGFTGSYHVALVGPGRLLPGGAYVAPAAPAESSALLIAGNAAGLAVARLRLAAPPSPSRRLIFVASYDDGLIVHDASDFSILGVAGSGGSPSDVGVDRTGRIAVTDTQGTALTVISLSPWHMDRVEDVPFGNEVAVDDATHAVFVTNRDADGSGALTRVGADGNVKRVATGVTAEGLVIDQRRHIVYVANAGDGTVTAVDAASMRVTGRFRVVDRVFSLALSPDGTRLYAISNQSAGSLFAAAGSAVAVSLRGARRVVARSGALAFPLGAALDANHQTLFVTEEGLNEIDVLDARTLRQKRAPLKTCRTPWKPAIDETSGRLYVPCAGDNAIDVFDTRTFRRVAHAPFATGSYPLAVEIWNPSKV